MSEKKEVTLSDTERTDLKKSIGRKIYRYYGISTAMDLLRPGARWEVKDDKITMWDDPRPCPSWDEINETIEKIKVFEDGINTIWLPKQIKQYEEQEEKVINAYEIELKSQNVYP